jgi:glycogen synthase
MKILHVLNHSVPHTDGYCVRSANIVEFQARIGLSPLVVTSPHHEPAPTQSREIIGGTTYYRLLTEDVVRYPVFHEFQAMRQMRERLEQVVRTERPAVIHAHSPCLWGYAARQVARRHRLPLVYEVRGLWEDAAVDQGRLRRSSLKYHLSRALETTVLQQADAVVGISRRLVAELAARGIEAGKLFYVPNAVNLDAFPNDDSAATEELQQQLGLQGRNVVAYIGSLYRWEGVDDLIRAAPAILQQAPDTMFLIVGRGEMEQELHQLVEQLSLEPSVRFVGGVPHEEISRYYALCDILVYPRRSSRQTEMVTPLKPLEAMLLGKAVLAADVGGLRELLPDDTRELFTPGQPDDLARQCLDLLAQPEKRADLGARAKAYVRSERSWSDVVRSYLHVYALAVQAIAPARLQVDNEALAPALATRY